MGAVTSWRSESSNISSVVLDKFKFFEKIQNRGRTDRWMDGPTDGPTDGQHLRIKSPRRRLKRSCGSGSHKKLIEGKDKLCPPGLNWTLAQLSACAEVATITI